MPRILSARRLSAANGVKWLRQAWHVDSALHPAETSLDVPRLTRRNIEDWDFRNTDLDAETDKFLSDHYTEVIAVEEFRLTMLTALVEAGYATVAEDREYVELEPEGFFTLHALSKPELLFTRRGRLQRRIAKALLREQSKHRRLRLTIIPRDFRLP